MKNKWLMAVYLLSIFNFLDAVGTISAVHFQYGIEQNPLMSTLINFSPLVFLGFKTILSLLMLKILPLVDGLLIKWLTGLGLFAYSILMLVHIRVLLLLALYCFNN